MKKTLLVLSGLILGTGLTAAAATFTINPGDSLLNICKQLLIPTSSASTTPPQTTTAPVTTSVGTFAGEVTFNAYITGYSYYDNTPPGSPDISNPIIHSSAGGKGTYADPITLAVGHSILNGKDILDFPAGTKFYMPYLKRYFIVEDTCGDGPTPQNGPCHKGYPSTAKAWLDAYVGKGSSQSASDSCMDMITNVHSVIQNPASTYPVVSGEIASNCSTY